ncbi:hypothetical protein DSECCO2_623620 [anaerobic digester metagenome]
MKPSSKLIRIVLLAFSATALFLVSTSCRQRHMQTKYGPPSDSYQDQPVTKYGVVTDTIGPVQTKYGVPVPENE